MSHVPVDFLAFKESNARFCLSPCSFDATIFVHRHFLPDAPSYNGEPIRFGVAQILDAVDLLRSENFTIEFVPADPAMRIASENPIPKPLTRWQRAGKLGAAARWGERGQSLLEFCLVIPVFLALCLGGMDVLWLEMSVASLDHVASESAMCIDQPSCDPVALGKSNAAGLGLNPDALTITIASKTVTLSYAFEPLAGFVIQAETLTRTATAP
jgi:hypothetical protein